MDERKGGYKPTPEDYEKAEGHLTPEERGLTWKRTGEKTFENNEDARLLHTMQSGEPKEPIEELSLEKQAQIYADFWIENGYEANPEIILKKARELQTEMTEQDRQNKKLMVYIPAGVSTKDMWEIIQKNNETDGWDQPYSDEDSEPKEIIAFANYSLSPDADSLGKENSKSAEEWEATGEKFMSPKLRFALNEFFRTAYGKWPDSIVTWELPMRFTLCPGSRSSNGQVLRIGFQSVPMFMEEYFAKTGKYKSPGIVGLAGENPSERFETCGVRRIVAKEF
ncbi:MAG: hypothetical protein PHW50_03530 [Patescibacteria group bacterium]|nr:hypothetical protein [Patescibacteria group bacterium]